MSRAGWGRGSGFEGVRFDEHNRDWCQSVGGGACLRVVLQDAPSETAGGGICIPKDVSSLRVDHAEVEGSLPGVRQAFPERSDRAERSKMS